MIRCMNDFDYSNLDGRLLRVLVTAVEAGAITEAARRLGCTQSAVSHQLDKLRVITGDPLFVKAGRGVAATARAQMLALDARALLASMQRFAAPDAFDPARWHTTVTIAANDFQRDVLLPPLMVRLRQLAPDVALRVIASGVPGLDMLRDGLCQLIVSPRPPDGSDIMQKRLFEDTYRVFYDATVRSAPRNRREYLQAEHITVLREPQRTLDIDDHLRAHGIQRDFKVMVPDFAGLAPFIRDSALLATVPGMLQAHLLRGLASTPPPVPCPRMPMYMIWHVRHQQDAAHRWLRLQLEDVARAAVSSPTGDAPA